MTTTKQDSALSQSLCNITGSVPKMNLVLTYTNLGNIQIVDSIIYNNLAYVIDKNMSLYVFELDDPSKLGNQTLNLLNFKNLNLTQNFVNPTLLPENFNHFASRNFYIDNTSSILIISYQKNLVIYNLSNSTGQLSFWFSSQFNFSKYGNLGYYCDYLFVAAYEFGVNIYKFENLNLTYITSLTQKTLLILNTEYFKITSILFTNTDSIYVIDSGSGLHLYDIPTISHLIKFALIPMFGGQKLMMNDNNTLIVSGINNIGQSFWAECILDKNKLEYKYIINRMNQEYGIIYDIGLFDKYIYIIDDNVLNIAYSRIPIQLQKNLIIDKEIDFNSQSGFGSYSLNGNNYIFLQNNDIINVYQLEDVLSQINCLFPSNSTIEDGSYTYELNFYASNCSARNVLDTSFESYCIFNQSIIFELVTYWIDDPTQALILGISLGIGIFCCLIIPCGLLVRYYKKNIKRWVENDDRFYKNKLIATNSDVEKIIISKNNFIQVDPILEGKKEVQEEKNELDSITTGNLNSNRNFDEIGFKNYENNQINNLEISFKTKYNIYSEENRKQKYEKDDSFKINPNPESSHSVKKSLDFEINQHSRKFSSIQN